MKKTLVIGMMVFATAVAQGLSLADASGQIDVAIESPATMTALVKQLSAADQVAFLARVNASIDALPGSPEEKAAKYLAANDAALRGAKGGGNIAALLAEVFATVPPEALTVINERFAVDLFSRTADPSKTIPDEVFVKMVQTAMKAIQKRTASVANADVRNTFAILMFLRASKGTPADLCDTLVKEYLTEGKAQALAKGEWIPPALNDKDYEPLLGASDAGEMPDAALVLRLAGAQTSLALLSDLAAGDAGMANVSSMFRPNVSGMPVLSDDSTIYRIPRTMNPANRNYGGYHRGDKTDDIYEPGGYSGQRIRF
ncbi:MAG: hypothetical protein ACI4R9_05885 [Kiritimatiellia bacterium]